MTAAREGLDDGTSDGRSGWTAKARIALEWGRRIVALAILVGGVWALNANQLDTCEDKQSIFGVVSKVCHRPAVTDPVVLGTVLVVLLLFAPDITEFSVFGLASLKLRLRAQEARADATEAELAAVRATVAAVVTSSNSAHAAQNTTVNLGLDTGLLSAIYAQSPSDESAGPQRGSGGADSDSAAANERRGRRSREAVHGLAEETPAVLARARLLAGDRAVAALLAGAADDLRAITASGRAVTHLHLPNDDGILLPIDEPSADAGVAAETLPAAVSEAWRQVRPVVRRERSAHEGLAASSGMEGDARLVSTIYTVPVVNASGQPVGVLSAQVDGPSDAPTDDQVARQLAAHAVAFARVVIDLLQWAVDD